MGLADENLRKGRAYPGAIPHFLPLCRIFCHVEFGKRRLLARQQRFRSGAIAAAGAGVDFDGGGHLGCLVERSADYMGALWVSTTRANTSTSTCAALARSSARAQASVVAPEVNTSSTSTTRRPWISAMRSGVTLN